MTRAASVLLVAIALLVAATAVARANALDTFGFSARAEGLAGAQAADARGYAAAHHNPAGVAMSTDIEAALGYGGAVMGLRIDGADAQVSSVRGISVGLAIPLKVRSWNFALGVALYLPDQFVARVQLVPATEPHFVLLDNNLHHLVVTAVLSVRPARWLSLGAGATVLADAAGSGLRFDVGVVGGEKVGSADLDVSLPIRAAPVLGLMIVPHRAVRMGLAWRGELDLGLSLDILANVNIAGAITGDTLIALRALNFYTPHKVSLGLAADLTRDLTITAELDWLGWSHFTGALPDLRVLVALGISPPLVESLFPKPHFDDVWVPRLGAELRRDLHPNVGLALRLGYAFERSPVPPQIGLTSFADNDRHVLAVGAGVELHDLISILPKPLRIDLALQLHELASRTTVKDRTTFVGQGFSSGGYLLHFAATVEARF